jgi:tetratricopeptide (TPR) repeat protein
MTSGDSPPASLSAETDGVHHLLELGYEDPLDAAARVAAVEDAQRQELQRAEQLLDEGQSAAAIALLESLAQSAPEWTGVRHLLARTYLRNGQVDAARSMLDWLEVNAVEHAELALMRASMALAGRDLDTAADQAQYARCLQQPLPAADLLLGEIHFRRGDLDAAEAAYRQAQEGAPAAAQAGLAAVALRRGDYARAVDRSLDALEGDLRLWSAHYRLGLALWRLQRWPEARTALETCARLNPRLAGPYRWLARLAELQEDRVAANEYRRRGRDAIQRRRR